MKWLGRKNSGKKWVRLMARAGVMILTMKDELKTEEDVKIKFLMPLLKERGYKESHCRFTEAIDIHEGRKHKKIFADVVVYTSEAKTTPLVLCETKSPNEILNKSAREQAISYARLLPRIAPLTLITNGLQVQVFQTLSKNRIGQLPTRRELEGDLVNLVVSPEIQEALRSEAKHGLFIIDDVQGFKSILKACHNEIRNNEGHDSIAAFDEMSKILFCKMYEEKFNESKRFRVAVFDDALNRLGTNVVKQIFEETKQNPGYKDLFEPEEAISLNDRTIRKIVSLFEDYDLSLTAFDVKGEAFEYFLGDTFTGGLGEYFTPRNIVEFIVDAVNPKIGDKIIDPFCGTGGFLIYAFDVVSEKIRLQEFSDDEKAKWKLELSNRSLFGTDWKPRTSQACKMNMIVHGDGSAGIFMHHGLTNVPPHIEEKKFDICLTNPPFGSIENDPAVLADYELGAGRNSQDRLILAIERAIKLVKPGGLVGIIIIDGILNTSSKSFVREYMKRHTIIKAIISLNKETFEGYNSRAKTSIVIMQKKVSNEEQNDLCFLALASNTGYAPNGSEVPGNELPEILLDYQHFLKDPKTPLGFHNVMVIRLEDRFDAEYYFGQNGKTEMVDHLDEIRDDVTGLLNFINLEHAELEQSIDKALRMEELTTVKIGDIVEEIEAKEQVKSDFPYRLLGVRWWGGGTFVREEKLGKEIKAKNLYRISKGWLIYNRLFAFRGSFAVVSPEHEGCYASGEFPTFAVKKHIEMPEITVQYLVHCLNSPQYLKIVDALSTGSTKTSRNRFHEEQFLSLSIRMPSKTVTITRIVELMNGADRLRSKQQELLEKVKGLREGITRRLP